MKKLIEADTLKQTIEAYRHTRNYVSDEEDAQNSLLDWILSDIDDAPAVNSDKWIPVTTRPMTAEEEKEMCREWGVNSLEDDEKQVFTCTLPDDRQEILISTSWGVKLDTCTWDDKCCGLEERGDWDGVEAWMPVPETYKKGERSA